MSPTPDLDRDDDFLAAEFVLGTLDAAARRRAERRLRTDTSFADEVAAWQGHLMPMIDAVEPVAAPAHVWNAVASELPRPGRAAEAPDSAVRRGVSAIWKWLALGSMGVAAASLTALVLLVGPGQNVSGPTFAASIAGEDGMPLYAAVINPETNTATLMPLVVSGDGTHAHELWLIPEGGAPLSLGLLDPAAPLRIEMAPEMLDEEMSGGGALAVSLEPAGGSPTGQPTGPVVGQGPLHSI